MVGYRRLLIAVLLLAAGGPLEAQVRWRFTEVWGYLMAGEEAVFTGSEPVTDIAYFSARVNDRGRLQGDIHASTLPKYLRQGRRIHLVVSAPANKALMHGCLRRDRTLRDSLIRDIVNQARGFDGVQIDFESMYPQEGPAYLAFLRQLKRKLPGSILSVALPARTQKKQDAFNYAAISTVADRVLIMAYDEHGRVGEPGPIASAGWCERVCSFARGEIPQSKLIMGLPLYGRVWAKGKPTRALKYPETLKLWQRVSKPAVKRLSDQTPTFHYQTSVTNTVYFEDIRSLSEKLSLYHGSGVRHVGFWRMGQGPVGLWKLMGSSN